MWDISEETRTSASGNEYSQARVQYRITDGPHENRRVFRNYIFDHPSEQAALIGQQGLKQLWTAQVRGSINVENLSVPTKIEIVLKTKESNGYGPRQEVVGQRLQRRIVRRSSGSSRRRQSFRVVFGLSYRTRCGRSWRAVFERAAEVGPSRAALLGAGIFLSGENRA